MDRKALCSLGAAAVAVALLVPSALRAQESDPYTIETVDESNGVLRALWMDIQVQIEQIEFLTIGEARAGIRVHRQPFRWVAGDLRRAADGSNLTYLVEQAGLAGSGLDAAAAEAAIDRAMQSWSSTPCFAAKVGVVKRSDTGADPDLFDGLLGYGDIGDHRLADIVHGGWMPPSFFDAVAGPGGGETVLALSVTFIFVGADGQPTDVDSDRHLDTATSEIYYNEGFAWLLAGEGGFDLESVALHELGHSLGIGHVREPLEAVMNPVYTGPHRELDRVDGAALCSIWGRWPH